MRSHRRGLAFLGVVLASGLVLAAVGIHAGQPPKKVRIIYTNDTMGYLEPCG